MGHLSGHKRATSPVIATVILVGIGIIIAVAASYWLSATAGMYTSFETIEIPTAYSTINPPVSNAKWGIVIFLKNSGSLQATITYVMVNDALIDDHNVSSGGSLTDTYSTGTSIPSGGLSLASGESTTEYIWIGSDLFSSGTSISVKLHSVSGISYIKLVKLT